MSDSPELPPPEHAWTVRKGVGHTNTGNVFEYLGRCACGWEGRWTTVELMAIREAWSHVDRETARGRS